MYVGKNTYASAVFSSVHIFFILDYLLSCETPKQCVTIIDVPGHVDFTFDLQLGVSWGDCGILVISAGKQFRVLEYRSYFLHILF